MSEPTPLFRHPIAWLRNKFLAGLALVIPLLVTIWILKVIHEFLLGMSVPLLLFVMQQYDPLITAEDPSFKEFVSFVGFLLPVLLVLAMGVLATNFIGARLVVGLDKLMLSIPIISFIYKSLKQVIEAFRNFGGSRNFKRVVYVDYPSPGMRLIGFVTGNYVDPKTKAHMSCVFLPGALSPMTGLLIVTETTRIEDAPLSVEDAMKMIFSGGLIGPGADLPGKRSKAKTRPVTLPVGSPDFAHLPKAEVEDHPDPPAGAVRAPVARG
jgi:uncharacterized membrane protein